MICPAGLFSVGWICGAFQPRGMSPSTCMTFGSAARRSAEASFSHHSVSDAMRATATCVFVSVKRFAFFTCWWRSAAVSFRAPALHWLM